MIFRSVRPAVATPHGRGAGRAIRERLRKRLHATHDPGNWVTIYRDRSNGREDIVMAATDGGAGVPQDQKTADEQQAAVVPGGAGTRASDRERDTVVQRVQDAFAEGRLDDAEFDERSRAALTARTHADLDALLADLPAAPSAPGPAPVVPAAGRFAVALE